MVYQKKVYSWKICRQQTTYMCTHRQTYVVARPVFFLQNVHLVFFPEASWGGGGGRLRITSVVE